MQRTPTRKSPRLQQLESSTSKSSGFSAKEVIEMENPATAAVGAAENPTTAAVGANQNPAIAAAGAAENPTTAAVGANQNPATAAAGVVKNPTTAAVGANQNPATAATGIVENPAIVAVGNNASSYSEQPILSRNSIAITTASYQIPNQQEILQTMQRQLNASEQELKTTQIKLQVSNFQCQTLNRALQSHTAPMLEVTAPLSSTATSTLLSSYISTVPYTGTSSIPLSANTTASPSPSLTATVPNIATSSIPLSANTAASPSPSLTATVPNIATSSIPLIANAVASPLSSFVATVPNVYASSYPLGVNTFATNAIAAPSLQESTATLRVQSSETAIPANRANDSSSANRLRQTGHIGNGNWAMSNTLSEFAHNHSSDINCITTQAHSAILRKVQDLPEFSGQAEDWPMFSTAYDQSTATYNYTNLENSQRLQKCLKGEARETVRSLLIHPENVSAVMEQLQFRFGRPEQLIRSQLRQIREVPPINEAAVERLIPFATKAKNLAVFLKSINGQQHLSNPTLLDELVSKLPMNFSNWLGEIASLICTVQESTCRSSSEPRRRVVLHAAEHERIDTIKCPVCQGRHNTFECTTFLRFSVNERWVEAKRIRICFACLEPGHSIRSCRRRKSCLTDGCRKRHHKLLHENRQVSSSKGELNHTGHIQPSTLTAGQVARENEAVLSCAANVVKKTNLLFRMLPVWLYGPNKKIKTYALLDEGSSITMIDNALIEELGLQGYQRQLNVQWFGGRAAQEPATVVDMHICGVGINKRYKLSNVYGVSNLSLPMQSLHADDLNLNNSCINKLPTMPYSNVTPKLLIGLDHSHLGLSTETITLHEGGPYAAKTDLGWVVFGPTKETAPTISSCLMINTREYDLHELVAEYFVTDSFGVRSAPAIESKEDLRARSILQATTKRVNGRFQAGLLWKEDNIELPDSYNMAKKRLVSIERKMKRDSSFATAYNEIMKGYITKQYARKLQPAEATILGPRTWYLPHFAVVNPNKPGKIRMVFDAAAMVNGTSLNSALLKGPQQYQPMPSVLYNFRVGAVAVCADIKEMFHQVIVRPGDRCSQRFLWRDGDDSRPPDIYEMIVMTFGAACSPCIAQHVKITNALEHDSHDPRAIKSILEHHYVDDFVDSFESVAQAIHIAKQVREIHKDAGFILRNFTSNSLEVAEALEGDDKNASVDYSYWSEDSLATEKILGMYWQPRSDTFRFHLKFHHVDAEVINGSRFPTKRELLSIVMSVFDPMGFLCNFLIITKLIMREVWRHRIGWDECLPDYINKAWSRWRQDLRKVVNIHIPRRYFKQAQPQKLELHIFVDASQEAFSAVSYWRAMNIAGEVEVSFICAKTKCAPLKPLTVPRLELQAAVLGTRLMQNIIESHSLCVTRCVLWTDSKTVLKWIASEHRRYKPFVAHRIAEILAATDKSNWNWVPTESNVADEATRSKLLVEFSSSSRWLNGPEFLLQEKDIWPSETCHDLLGEDDDEELRPKFTLLAVNNILINFNRFSSLNKLKRTMAWVLRFVKRRQKTNSTDRKQGLTVAELEEAEAVLLKRVQAEVYSNEINKINKGQSLDKNCVLYTLTPYIDSEGILRVNGRIDVASCLPYCTKRPIILPPNHLFTKLIVNHHHCLMKHQNHEATICEIRRRFWVPRLRQVLKGVVASCYVCRIARAVPVVPYMGSVPENRLTPYIRPFSFTGLDYFRPLTVTIGRRTEKRWVALFTCLTIRAIHLEIAHDLSTDACILAIRNFSNRRGLPARIRSDNGKKTTSAPIKIGADQVAKRFDEVFDCGRLQDEVTSKGIEWIFNCPCNPSEGGIWERMVLCVKRVLNHTLKEVAPREHTLHSFLIEAENVVNSRPLTHLPVSVDQEEPLTPNHFLLGSANTAQTPRVIDVPEKQCVVRKQWQIARQLRNRFWKRWISEYLPTLTRRTKCCPKTKPIQIGDLVFVCDSNMARKKWCRGRVEQVYCGKDSVIRRADVRTKTGILRRPVSKLAVLDLDSSESVESIHGGGDVAERPL